MKETLTKIIQEEQDTQHGKFLTFALDEEFYGIEICYVTEIVGVQKISVLPGAPPYIKGVINLRGRIIPVADMRLRFRKEVVPYTSRTCIIVVEIGDCTVGLIVDEVREVAMIPDECVAPPPDMKIGYRNRFIKGIGKAGDTVQLLLDCEQLFKEDEVRVLDQIEA
ncbi:MAG: purine-binding chemotaxis protein CheW [Ruminococcaceae bacterium]|jgi:Chemotaxis signal transduction protein|nr:purine-binding chemotaxis protein CheW [Oscillospiraceae bacterium]